MDYRSVFDIPVKDQFGNENMLEQYRGKVLMFVNTTGHCGNASQWPVLNSIMDEYRDKNFQIIYVPTNDYCGSVTVEPYKDGIKDAKESFEYANRTYNIKDPFTELLSSRDEPWTYKVDTFVGKIGEWVRNYDLHDTLKQEPKSELYKFLSPSFDIQGNFHKFLTNSKGKVVAQIQNYILNPGPRNSNNIQVLEDKILLNDEFNITSLVNQFINFKDLKNTEFPAHEVRKLLYELGPEKIKSINPNIEYYSDEELVGWNHVKELYLNIDDWREARSREDIVKIKSLINEILETDTTNNEEFLYNPDYE